MKMAQTLLKMTTQLLPVTCWYRLAPNKKGEIEEDYNHFNEGHIEGKFPPPKGGTTFSGKWIYKHKYRTNELVPKIVDTSEDST